MTSKYIKFVPQPDIDNHRCFLVTTKNGTELGWVYWFRLWKRFIFQPRGKTIFDYQTLNDIPVFINDLMLERKLKKQNNGK